MDDEQDAKELDEEVEYGHNVADMLCQHLEAMGAANVEIPITRNSGCYIVKVVKTL